MKWTVICLVILLMFILTASAGTATPLKQQPKVQQAVCTVFGTYCYEALSVAWCESRWNVWAHNGQYLGLFQMGSSERRRYGHGRDAWTQARAANRYFIASGRDWSPWECQP